MNKLKVFNKTKLSFVDLALMLLLIVAVVVLFIMSMSSYDDASETNIAFAKQSIEEITKQSAKEIEAKFEEKFAILEYVATLSYINKMNWSDQYAFIKGNEDDLGFEHVFIMDTDGKGYYVKDKAIRDQSGEEFFANIKGATRYITEPFSDDTGSITTLCVPIYRKNVRVGTLCGAFNLEEVFQLVKEMQPGDGLATVVNYKGEYVASGDMKQVYEKHNIFDTYKDDDIALIKNNLTKDETVTGEITIDGVEYYTSMVKMEGCNWKVILTVDKDQTMGDMDELRNTQIASVVILLTVIIVTIRFMIKLHMKDRMAFVDQVTGISNRARCTIIMDKLETHRKEDIMIVSFDLNDFKDINDAYGHKEGDEAIKVFAKVLNRTFGKYGFVGRMGGDEFIAILVDSTKETYEKLINDMKQHIKNVNADRNQKYVLSTSYGCAVRTPIDAENDKTVQDTYEEADKNMYEYKGVYKSIKKNS